MGETTVISTEDIKQYNNSFIEFIEGNLAGKYFAINKELLTIGRTAENDIAIADSSVSSKHAKIVKDGLFYKIIDNNSTNGTYVNEQKINEHILKNNDIIEIHPHKIRFVIHEAETHSQTMVFKKLDSQTGSYDFKLANIDYSKGFLVLAENIDKIVDVSDGKKLQILNKVNFVALPGDFIIILGQSGSGKSTLLNSLTGKISISNGMISLNNRDFYKNFNLFNDSIGYVPQFDLIHRQLTVYKAFYYSAKLRLNINTSEQNIESIIEDTLKKVELAHRRDVIVDKLSGGQIKRVNLGIELISDPKLLFLDEATSGLDAGTEEKMMHLFKQIAAEGKTVICITHMLDNVNLADLVYILEKGNLIFCGKPSDALKYYNIPTIGKVYAKISEGEAGKLKEDFEKSSYYANLVTTKIAKSKEILEKNDKIIEKTFTNNTPEINESSIKPNMQKIISILHYLSCLLGYKLSKADLSFEFNNFVHQLYYLTKRYTEITMKDFKNLFILLAQSPVIASIIAYVMGNENKPLVILLSVVSCMWFGCINSCREIVKELNIYKRERSVGLKIQPYILSKIIVLTVLCLIQTVIFTVIVYIGCEFKGPFIFNLIGFFITSILGVALGLMISAIANSPDKAVSLIPFVLIPQIIFNVKFVYNHFEIDGILKLISQLFIPTYWAIDSIRYFENEVFEKSGNIYLKNSVPSFFSKISEMEILIFVSIILFSVINYITYKLLKKNDKIQ
ncbi:MAG: ATP-binding cassette domain-containing protein [Candidatus Wallbacteria bacterium]